jgi:hypothetical protein
MDRRGSGVSRMKIAKFTFEFDTKHQVSKVVPEAGVTQTDCQRAITVLARMRRALEDLRPTLPLN